MAKVAIIGLGTVGASIGLALGEAFGGGKGRRSELLLVGYDPERRRAGEALSRRAVQEVAGDLAEAVESADLVVLSQAAPAVCAALAAIAPCLPAGAVVCDTANAKVGVLQAAEQHLPAGVSFVGGHPIALPQQEVDWAAGPRGARADLYAGGIFCLVPARGASSEAVDTVRGLARALGATPFFLDPFEHDGLWAGLSQAPYLLATAMLSTIGVSEAWRDLKLLADPTFRRLGELLGTAPAEATDDCLANRQSLLSWIDRLVAALQEVRRELAAPGSAGPYLQKLAESSRRALDDWNARRDERRKELEALGSQGIPGAGEQFLGMFLPRGLLEKRGRGER